LGGEALTPAKTFITIPRLPSLGTDCRHKGRRNPAMPHSASLTNYRLGSLYSLTTAFLLATQEPFSFLAAKRLSATQFVCLTQIALLLSIPLLLSRTVSRRDFVALLTDRANFGKLAVILAIGLCGLLLYNLGLSNAHPIIISAVLNLSPFWAALVALVISRKPIPLSPAIFFSCLAGAFIGAMAVAWSQIGGANRPSMNELTDNILHGSWIYAVPIPIISALNGTLIGKWFRKYDESAAIAANFAVANLVLIPTTIAILYHNSQLQFDQAPAILLMIIGTIIAAAVGRVVYQISLTVTDNDNGFVTMFFLLVPALTSLISIPMSWWITDLNFLVGPMFFFGLIIIAASLALFSVKSWR
jgi:drug/metabolite transporter (DMT)-like permease